MAWVSGGAEASATVSGPGGRAAGPGAGGERRASVIGAACVARSSRSDSAVCGSRVPGSRCPGARAAVRGARRRQCWRRAGGGAGQGRGSSSVDVDVGSGWLGVVRVRWWRSASVLVDPLLLVAGGGELRGRT